MSLLIDSDHVTLNDLVALDSEIPTIASNEKIVIEGERGIIRESWSECADKLLENMQAFGSDATFQTDPVGWLRGGFGINRSRIKIEQVVMSSPLKRWMTYAALAMFYRNAVRRTVGDDRIAVKMDMATEERDAKWRTLKRIGLPISYSPIPCPGATHIYGAGSFTEENVTTLPDGNFPAGAYDVAISWYRNTDMVSSGRSEIVSVNVNGDEQIQVNIVGLLPPIGATSWIGWVAKAGSPLFSIGSMVGLSVNSVEITGIGSGVFTIREQSEDSILTFQNVFHRA